MGCRWRPGFFSMFCGFVAVIQIEGRRPGALIGAQAGGTV